MQKGSLLAAHCLGHSVVHDIWSSKLRHLFFLIAVLSFCTLLIWYLSNFGQPFMTHGCLSDSSSSSTNSPSSYVVASWYCWYSKTRSSMVLSASVNSFSSKPSLSCQQVRQKWELTAVIWWVYSLFYCCCAQGPWATAWNMMGSIQLWFDGFTPAVIWWVYSRVFFCCCAQGPWATVWNMMGMITIRK